MSKLQQALSLLKGLEPGDVVLLARECDKRLHQGRWQEHALHQGRAVLQEHGALTTEEVVAAKRHNGLCEAAALYRQRTACSLTEAKQAIQAWRHDNPGLVG